MEKHSVRKKIGEKWQTFGNVAVNQWGNLELGLRITPELRALIESVEDGKWINFRLLPDKPREEKPEDDKRQAQKAVLEEFDDEIPF